MAAEVRSVFTDRRHGDLAVGGDPDDLRLRRAAIASPPWTWLRQVHGADVVAVTAPGDHAGAEADAVVTAAVGAPIAVHTADCGPLLLEGPGTLGVAHVGWRGLLGGVIEATAAAMAALGGAPTRATLGPNIRARCYEFGPDDLAPLVDRYGPALASTTGWGTDALDVGAGVAVACEQLAIELDDLGTCTACSPNHWSHRARGDRGRQALVAWLAP